MTRDFYPIFTRLSALKRELKGTGTNEMSSCERALTFHCSILFHRFISPRPRQRPVLFHAALPRTLPSNISPLNPLFIADYFSLASQTNFPQSNSGSPRSIPRQRPRRNIPRDNREISKISRRFCCVHEFSPRCTRDNSEN